MFWDALAWLGIVGAILFFFAAIYGKKHATPAERPVMEQGAVVVQFRALVVLAISVLWLIFGD